MNDYSIVLYLHIVSALGMFAALGVEWIGLAQIQSAQNPGQIRPWMGILKSVPKVGFPSMLAAVFSGLYLMWRAWGGTPWLLVSIGALVLVIALSVVLTGPRMAAIGRALMTGSTAQTFHSLANDPLLRISIQTRIAIVLGIIFLKTAKPDWVGALVTIIVAVVLGIASALSAPRRAQAPAQEVMQ